MKKFCKYCKDKTKHENDKCLECESLSNTESESESDGEEKDEYMKMFYKKLKLETERRGIPDLIYKSRTMSSLRPYGFQIVELFESDGEDEYRIYCENCKLKTKIKYDSNYHNFICQSCDKSLKGDVYTFEST